MADSQFPGDQQLTGNPSLMIYAELLQECKMVLDDLKLTPKKEIIGEDKGGGEIIRFYSENGSELCVYIKVKPDDSALHGTHAFCCDYEEVTTKAGDVFRFERNAETIEITSYVQLSNLIWAHRYHFKSILKGNVREYHDDDLLALILELERKSVPHELKVVNRRPRVSITLQGEEIASVRKSAGRLRYQDVTGAVSACRGIKGEAVKEFIATILDDVTPEISKIKKIR